MPSADPTQALILRCRSEAEASKDLQTPLRPLEGSFEARLRGHLRMRAWVGSSGSRLAPVWALGALLLLAAPAYAVQPDEVLKDPALESRARHISEGLRCLVCQNQSIDDSDAPLAKDLRVIVRERLTAGDSDPQVVDYVVKRYGEFVLLKPVFAWHTLLLWLTPLLAIALGAFGIWRLSRRRAPAPQAGLSEAEQREIEALTGGKPAEPKPGTQVRPT